jgi:tetratricopeptide (TPR) repeat protein
MGAGMADGGMTMKSTITAAAILLAGTAMAAAPASAQQNYGAQAAPQTSAAAPEPQAADQNAIKTHTPKISRESAKAIQQLQKDVNDKNSAAIAADVAAANAAAKTGDDRYVIGILQLKAAAQAKDNAGIAAAIEAMLASGSTTQEEKFPLYLNLAQTYSALNQDARAAQAYQQALQLNPSSVDATGGLAEAKVAAGQAAEGLALLEKGIALQSTGAPRRLRSGTSAHSRSRTRPSFRRRCRSAGSGSQPIRPRRPGRTRSRCTRTCNSSTIRRLSICFD